MSRRVLGGFTLIELLVVVAIIALLVGILLPALAGAKQAAESTKCLSNTRTIALAMQMFADDDPDNHYPTARMPADAPIELSWLHRTLPYTETIDVYRCPTDRSSNFPATNEQRDMIHAHQHNGSANAQSVQASAQPVADHDHGSDDHADTGTVRFTSYGINAYFTPNHPPYNGITPAHVLFPSQTIIAAELIEDVSMDHFMPMFWGDPPAVANAMMQQRQWDHHEDLPKTIFHTRHTGQRANYVFTDGHAGSHPFEDTWQQHHGQKPSRNWYDPGR